jgi:hypothetical protein
MFHCLMNSPRQENGKSPPHALHRNNGPCVGMPLGGGSALTPQPRCCDWRPRAWLHHGQRQDSVHCHARRSRQMNHEATGTLAPKTASSHVTTGVMQGRTAQLHLRNAMLSAYWLPNVASVVHFIHALSNIRPGGVKRQTTGSARPRGGGKSGCCRPPTLAGRGMGGGGDPQSQGPVAKAGALP